MSLLLLLQLLCCFICNRRCFFTLLQAFIFVAVILFSFFSSSVFILLFFFIYIFAICVLCCRHFMISLTPILLNVVHISQFCLLFSISVFFFIIIFRSFSIAFDVIVRQTSYHDICSLCMGLCVPMEIVHIYSG